MNVNQSFDSEKFEMDTKFVFPFVISKTDAQNGLFTIILVANQKY